jgi:hypothetical protein
MPKLFRRSVFTIPVVAASTAGGLRLPVVSGTGEPILPSPGAASTKELRA